MGVHVEKILLPIDNSDSSLRAAEYAIHLANKEKAQIFCVHIINRPAELRVRDDSRDPLYEDIRKSISKLFEKIRGIAKKENVSIATEIYESESVTEGIVRYATQKNIDLIILATRGSTQSRLLLMGSVAMSVVTHAPCSVLVVR